MLDRWSSYIVMIVWGFAWVDSALVVFHEWSSYGGGCLNRFDCSSLQINMKNYRNIASKDFVNLNIAFNLHSYEEN